MSFGLRASLLTTLGVPLLMGALPFKLPPQVENIIGTPDNDRAPWEWRERKLPQAPGAKASARGIYQPLFITKLVSTEASNANILEAVTQGSAWNHRELSSPVFDPATRLVIVGTSDRQLHAVSVKTGERVWHKELDGRLSSTPVMDGENVLFGADDGRIYSVRAATGHVNWTHQTDSEITAAITVFGDRLYAHTALDSVVALNRSTGAWQWQARHALPVGISLLGEGAVGAGMVLRPADTPLECVFVGHADGTLSALDASDGHELWNVSLGKGDDFIDVDTDVIYDAGTVYAAGFHGGVFALDPLSGATTWSAPEVDGINRMTLTAHHLVVAGPRVAMKLDRADGHVQWKYAYPTGGSSRPVVHRGRVLVSTDRGALYVLSLLDGRPLQYYGGHPGFTAQASVYRDVAFVLSNGGWLHALSDRYPGVTSSQRDQW